jgi:transposase
MLAIAEQVENQ